MSDSIAQQTVTITDSRGQPIATVEAVDQRDAIQKLVADGTDLRGADLGGANLDGANLDGATINWNSHDLIAELLRRAAGDDVEKRKVAGLILVSRDWCWGDFLLLRKEPLFFWALDVLSAAVRDGDNAPDILRASDVASVAALG
jgi:uncharacterized protein YjbI with pentapeptide repeats